MLFERGRSRSDGQNPILHSKSGRADTPTSVLWSFNFENRVHGERTELQSVA